MRRQFPTRYTAEDAALLARVDAAHEELIRASREEEFCDGSTRSSAIGSIRDWRRSPVSHLYNLRRSKAYRKVRVRVEHTRASQVSIGERRKPEPLE